jgi:peroxiredoxin
MPKIALLLLLVFTIRAQASPADAERVKRSFELAVDTWALKLKIAESPEERQELLAKRPDPATAANDIWSQIAPSLKEDWSIPYASFFLDLTRNLTVTGEEGITKAAFTEERNRILASFTANHLEKPGIAPFSIALTESGDPKSLPLLEKIIESNPDETTQGIAALGAAMLLRELGDAPEVMKKRLTYLRKAIILASDETVGEKKVSEIAADELYVIRFLAKGRIAPDLSGTDVSGRVIRLSDLKGKIVVLLFWDAKSPDTDRIIGLTNQMVEKHQGKPVTVIGITPESHDRIRALQADGSIKWNNIIDPTEKLSKEYRITSRPAVLVLGTDGKIEYTGLPGSFAELTVDALLAGDAVRR